MGKLERNPKNMAVVQVIENGGARLEVVNGGKLAEVSIDTRQEADGKLLSIFLDAEDLKALIKRCRTVLAEIEG